MVGFDVNGAEEGDKVGSNEGRSWRELTRISDAGIEILAPYFEGNTTFKGICLEHNKGITDKSTPLLMKILESSYIVRMNVYETLITQQNTIALSLASNIFKYMKVIK